MSTIALFAIARPTFDVPLAQSVADGAVAQLEAADHRVVGGRGELLMDAAAAERAVAALQLEAIDNAPDLIILLQASFADSTMAVQIARALASYGAPLLLWAVPDQRSGGRLRLNSLCGINLAGHAFTQHGIGYSHLLASVGDVQVPAVVEPLVRAGMARQRLIGAQIGVIGEYPAGFETCAYDAVHLRQLFGVEVKPIALPALLENAAAVTDVARAAVVERLTRTASNTAELDATATAGTAGVYCALRQLADEDHLAGMAVRCWPEFFTELGCAACGAMSLLNDELCPASCEADVNGTVTSILLQTLSGSQAFITDLVSIEAESDSGVLWHCGLAPVAMADPEAPVRGTVHSNRQLPFLFEFPLKPGRVTLARLHRRGLNGGLGDYRLVIGGGEMVRAPQSFGGTSGVVRFDKPALDVLDRIMAWGLEHHVSITYGDVRPALRAFAKLVGLDVLELT